MPRTQIALKIDDLSSFTKSLSSQLGSLPEKPGHLSMLNIVARAAGFKNYQHVRSDFDRSLFIEPDEATNPKRVTAALREFDAEGRLKRWPSKRSIQDLCIWVLWTKLPSRTAMSEPEVNAILNQWHVFKDPAILRRMLVVMSLATRNLDGSNYERVESKPPSDVVALLSRLRGGN